MASGKSAQWPYPLAFTYRHYETAREPRERFEHAKVFLETVLTFLGLVAAGWAHRHRSELSAFVAWERKLRSGKGVALGDWLNLFDVVVREAGVTPNDAIPLRDAELPGLLLQYTRSRNDYSHGGGPRRPADLDMELSNIEQLIDCVVDRLQDVIDIRLLHVERCRLNSNGAFSVETRLLAGPGPTFEPVTVRSSDPFEEGAVLALVATGPAVDRGLEDAFDLSGWCLLQDCPECQQRELFGIHREQQTKRRYRSFEYGHGYETGTPQETRSARRATPRSAETRSEKASGSIPRDGQSRTGSAASPGARRQGAFDSEFRHPEQSTRRPLGLAGSVPRRLVARLIDSTCAAALGAGIAGFAWLAAELPGWVSVLAGLIPAILYEPLLLAPAKRALDLGVYDVDSGRPLGHAKTLARCLLLFVELVLIFPAGAGIYWMINDPAGQAWHDRIVKTVVVCRSETLRQFTRGVRRAAQEEVSGSGST